MITILNTSCSDIIGLCGAVPTASHGSALCYSPTSSHDQTAGRSQAGCRSVHKCYALATLYIFGLELIKKLRRLFCTFWYGKQWNVIVYLCQLLHNVQSWLIVQPRGYGWHNQHCNVSNSETFTLSYSQTAQLRSSAGWEILKVAKNKQTCNMWS